MLRDPAVSYCNAGLQDLKDRLIASIERCGDEEGLEQCTGILHTDTMPCVYTDNEFIQVLAEAETGGNACEEDVRRLFAGWGQLRIIWRKRALRDLNDVTAWHNADSRCGFPIHPFYRIVYRYTADTLYVCALRANRMK